MMRRQIAVVLVLMLGVVGRGQAQPQPGGSASKVDWAVQGDTLAPGAQGVVSIRASIAEGWKMYAPDSPPPTRGVAVAVDTVGAGLTVDSLQHADSESGHDPNFGITVRYFRDTAQLRLPVSVASTAEAGRSPVEGRITFMVCTDEICLPPTTTAFTTQIQVGREGDS